MSEHRKPVVAKRETITGKENVKKAAHDFANLGSICAWYGCTKTFDGDMPPNWSWLITYWGAPETNVRSTLGEISMSPFCTRDAALCPKHAGELENNLKPLARALDKTVGTA